MFQFRKIRFKCMFVICSVLIFAEAAEKKIRPISSNPSITTDSSTFNTEKEGGIRMEYVREHNVYERVKSVENSLMKILTLVYNGSLPFISHVNKHVDISVPCKRDLTKLLTGLKDFEYWAVKMFDSFGKIPNGVVFGTLHSFGDYDQCLDVDVKDQFQGQYCNLDLIFPMPSLQPFVTQDTEIPEVKRALKPEKFLSIYFRNIRFLEFIHPRTAICVPSTCTRGELQTIANEAMRSMNLSLGLHITNCEILNQDVKFDRIQIAIITLLGILLILVISATALDLYLKSMLKEEENGKSKLSLPTKYLMCFSLYTNVNRLLKSETDKDSIKIFHGLRVLLTLWVIAVHTCFYQNFQATGSTLALYKFITERIPFQFVANGFINVQTFFFMSSTLHALRVMKMKNNVNIKKHIFRRIWRLAPPFMLVIACVILLPHFGSGPVWRETMEGHLADKCRANWWTNLLFINNFVSHEHLCLQWLWYIPVDFQLYVLSLIVLIPMKRNPALGLTIAFVLMIGAFIISSAFHVYYNLTPMLVLAFSNPKDVIYFVDRGYLRTYLHCSSICIGLVVGYFLVNRPPKLRIPPKINILLWLVSVSVCIAIVLGVYRWSAGHIPPIGVSALYAGGSKILWSAAMAWITIACTTGNGGFVSKILSLPVFVPLGRLCYMVYLIHSVIHYMYLGSNRGVLGMDVRTMGYMYCGTVFISFLCAFVLTLFFESPFMALDKLMFDDKTSENSKRLKTVENAKQDELTSRNGDVIDEMNSVKKVA